MREIRVVRKPFKKIDLSTGNHHPNLFRLEVIVVVLAFAHLPDAKKNIVDSGREFNKKEAEITHDGP
jgi:hypothetical protein